MSRRGLDRGEKIMLDYITSGESHNKYMVALLEGFPSGVAISEACINEDLRRRQQGYGRGGRMQIETDTIVLTSGMYKGKSTGSPLGLMIENTDVKLNELPQLTRPRPGHADLVGALKYDQGIRQILERASARETALRVAVGNVCKQFLAEFGIECISHITGIGSAHTKREFSALDAVKKKIKGTKLNCISPTVEKKMIAEIKKATEAGDTVGGEIEFIVSGVPAGLGSFVHHRRKLDAAIAAGLMSVQAIKAVQFGIGTQYGEVFGSVAHDEIFYSKQKGYYRKTNNAGGVEGGMSNGAEIVVRATMKPIATLKQPLQSVDMKTHKPRSANFERSDVCAVTACGVIGEAVLSYEIARAFLEKFGGDSLREIKRNYKGYVKQIA